MILTMFIMLPGCWDQNEIERLGIVNAVAIDKSEEDGKRFRVLVQLLNPRGLGGRGEIAGMGGGSGGEAPFRNLSAEGFSIFDAFRELAHISPRRLFYAHTQVILISEELLMEKNILEMLDFFERSTEIRRQVWLLVARTSLNDLFSITVPLENTTSQKIAGVSEREREQVSRCGMVRLGDFLRLYQSEGVEPFTAGIVMMPSKAMPQDMAPRGISEQEIEISGTAVFKNGRLAGWLDDKEGRGLLWLRGEVGGGVILIPHPDSPERNISLEILRSKTRVRPEITDGEIRIIAEIMVESNVNEASIYIDLGKPEVIRKLEVLQGEKVFQEINTALSKLQGELRSDVFGFGNSVYRQNPAYWRQVKADWDEIFPNLEVEVSVNSKVRRTGLVGSPARPAQ